MTDAKEKIKVNDESLLVVSGVRNKKKEESKNYVKHI